MRKWLALMLAVALVMLSTGAQASVLEDVRNFLFGEPQPKAMSSEEARAELERQAKVLAALGITPLRDGQIDEMIRSYESIPEEYRGGLDLTHQLLYAFGMGDYDYDAGVWTPTSDRVYAFDMEVFFINSMYTDFLKGVEAINRGEFEITGVSEDTSKADWDTNTGTQTIRFEYDGHPYEYAAKFDGDWLDMGVVAFMNGVFEAEGNPKRLYCFGDQVQVIFYDTPEWVARFTEATGQALDKPYTPVKSKAGT